MAELTTELKELLISGDSSAAILAARPSQINIPEGKNAIELQREGFLYKKQQRTNKWRKYYFVFEPQHLELQYYSSKDVIIRLAVKRNPSKIL
jgi:hypothetical protein